MPLQILKPPPNQKLRTAEEIQAADEAALAEQAKWPLWKRLVMKGGEQLAGGMKGAIGIDDPTFSNKAVQLGMAAAPLAGAMKFYRHAVPGAFARKQATKELLNNPGIIKSQYRTPGPALGDIEGPASIDPGLLSGQAINASRMKPLSPEDIAEGQRMFEALKKNYR